jgi:hypothetical protein
MYPIFQADKILWIGWENWDIKIVCIQISIGLFRKQAVLFDKK